MSLHQNIVQKISFKARTIAKEGKCIFCYHFGRHLEYLKMLNDANVASVRFLTGKVWATRISKEKKFEHHFQVNPGICWTSRLYWPPLVRTFNVGDPNILSDHSIIEFSLITSFDFSNTANENEGDAQYSICAGSGFCPVPGHVILTCNLHISGKI